MQHYASPRSIRRRQKFDDPRRGKRLRAFAKHRDDMQVLNSANRVKFNGFGFLDMLKRAFGLKEGKE